jgi:hypothetical protein
MRGGGGGLHGGRLAAALAGGQGGRDWQGGCKGQGRGQGLFFSISWHSKGRWQGPAAM